MFDVVVREPLELPAEEDLWVFGYGSLMWHPGFPHVEVRHAHLYGFHRRFCVFSHRYRGTPDCPGLVFGLDRGGSCRGLAYRVPRGERETTMEYLYERELITGVYIPRWVRVLTEGGWLRAATFVVDPEHNQYAGRLSEDEMARLVLQGEGLNGRCSEYLENTIHHMKALGVSDHGLERLLARVRRTAAA